MLLVSSPVLADSAVFTAVQFKQIEQQHQGKNWLLLLWSLDCPPCFKELAQVSKLKKLNPQLPVILVNTDGDEDLNSEIEALISEYSLDGLTNLHFADGKAAQARYIIDSSWYGELPRSYFYKTDGSRSGRSGLVTEATLKRWLF